MKLRFGVRAKFLIVTISIVVAVALALTTPFGVVVHSWVFKLDQ